jgi:trans-aconitate 2-methyltransferase
VLDATEQAEFLAQYAQRLAAAYPPATGGRTLFPFRRPFIVANR